MRLPGCRPHGREGRESGPRVDRQQVIRSFVIRALPLVGLLIVGAIILAIAGSHTVGFALGFGTIGIAGVLLAALFFYEVGRSEDRARASRGKGASPQSRGA
jgi:hypothetical protein